MMSNNIPPVSVILFRVIAVVVLFFTATACGLQAVSITFQLDHPDTNLVVPVLFVPPILIFIGGLGLATLLEGVARLISQPRPAAVATDSSTAIGDLVAAISELQTTLPGLIAQAIQPAEPVEEQAHMPTLGLIPESAVEQHLQRMVKLLEEMKEVSMLDETQRQSRRQQTLTRRKSSRLEEVARLINRQEWSQADALLHLLESLHPGDAEVLACRNQLDDLRIASQADEWDQLKTEVDDHLALSRYTEAVEAIMQFLERYPTHLDGQQLAHRIKQEQQIFIESTSLRMYEEIKSHVENRRWRTALGGIQDFLERFPTHSRANKIRQQMPVIQKNAEIEERHEQESRIRELINAQQFTEATELCEDLLQRFPDAPQAAYLTDLLPKLRERSAVGSDAVL